VHHNIVSKIFFEENMNLSKKDAFVFISIGRLIKHKNVDLVLKSFKIFNDKYPSSILKIVGDGPEMNFLKDEVFKLKITNNVIFLGKLSRREVVYELKHSHIFVSGSIYETFGVVFIEALAQGLPVLSTPCEGVFDIVNDQNGIIISSSTPSDMSKAMFLIFDNFDNFNKRQIIDECQFKFSEETQSKRLIDYYQKVIN
jgi:glycosyltransferase involved in cell wall biosynthesis